VLGGWNRIKRASNEKRNKPNFLFGREKENAGQYSIVIWPCRARRDPHSTLRHQPHPPPQHQPTRPKSDDREFVTLLRRLVPGATRTVRPLLVRSARHRAWDRRKTPTRADNRRASDLDSGRRPCEGAGQHRAAGPPPRRVSCSAESDDDLKHQQARPTHTASAALN